MPHNRCDEAVDVCRAELGIWPVRTETTMDVRPKRGPSGHPGPFILRVARGILSI
jgi:hypothetical protein